MATGMGVQIKDYVIPLSWIHSVESLQCKGPRCFHYLHALNVQFLLFCFFLKHLCFSLRSFHGFVGDVKD